MRGWRHGTVLGLFAWGLMVAAVTLESAAGRGGGGLPEACLICGSRGVADAVLNTLLFMPLGTLLGRRGWSWTRVLLLACLTSACIEIAQLGIPGRFSTLGDVAWNSAGAVLGARMPVWFSSTRVAQFPNAVGAVVALGVVCLALLTGWLLTPSLPADQDSPVRYVVSRYPGPVFGTRLNDRPITPGVVLESPDELASNDTWRLETSVGVSDARPNEWMVVGILDRYGIVRRALGIRGGHVILSERLRAGDVRLGQPDFWSDFGLDTLPPGSAVRLTASVADGELCLSVDDEEACRRAPTIGRGWSVLLYPGDLSDVVAGLVDFAWAFLIVLPVGWLTKRVSLLGIHGLVLLVGFALVAELTPLALAGPEVVALVLGLAVSYALRHAIRGLGSLRDNAAGLVGGPA